MDYSKRGRELFCIILEASLTEQDIGFKNCSPLGVKVAKTRCKSMMKCETPVLSLADILHALKSPDYAEQSKFLLHTVRNIQTCQNMEIHIQLIMNATMFIPNPIIDVSLS